MNTICVYGRLASDVTVNDVNGRHVANFRVASRTRRKESDGEYITNFYSVTAWGALADNAAKFLKKGHRTVVSGEFVIRPYVGNDGSNRYAFEIDANNIDLVETKSESGGTEAPANSYTRTNSAPQGFTRVEQDDDLPF